MKRLALPYLWMACAALAAFCVAHFFSCHRGFEAPRPPAPAVPPAASPRVPKAAPPSYTFVDPGSPAPAVAKKPAAQAAGESAPLPSRAVSPPDTALPLRRQQPATAAAGKIPDLDIDLANYDITSVMARYGYLPAVKTRTRLLGKISGERFLPLAPEEVARYARRGRSGVQYPGAEPWRRRIAAELGIPLEDIQMIFLVPVATESLFVQAQLQALTRAGKPAEEIALMRAHFGARLEVIVDELITRAGEILAMDSLQQQ